MRTRRYEAEDLESLARVGAVAFGGGVADWKKYYLENPRLDLDLVSVIEEDGEVRASATVLPLEVFVDELPRPMGGISAVATDPAYRRRGYAGELMRAVQRVMRERGMHLSMLNPFAHAFYRAYGWELASESISYTLKPTDLLTSPEQRRVRACGKDDLPGVMALLDEEASGYACCVRRGEGRWREILGRADWEAAVYEREGRLEGYILYKMSEWREESEPHRTLTVQDLVWRTPGAREAMISFLAAQDPLVFEIKHQTPRGEPFHPYLRSSYVKAEIEPGFMLRLVDVEGALKLKAISDRRSAISEKPLALEVSDEIVPENTGSYTIGNGEVVRGAEADERVSLDVRQLARLYAGYLPARQLARYGLIGPSSPKALELLEAYFPTGEPWVFPPDNF